MGDICPRCRRRTHSSRITFPDWPGDWTGWTWVNRQQFALRTTPARVLMIDEEGHLMSDNYWSENQNDLELPSPTDALRVANLIADIDGGWRTDEEDA